MIVTLRNLVGPPDVVESGSIDDIMPASVMVNLMRWNKVDPSGKPQHHPIDDALSALYRVAMCGSESAP